MFRTIARMFTLLVAMMVAPWAAQAQPALEKATLTGQVTAMTCVITTYDGGAPRAETVPCDSAGTTFTIAPNQSLGVLATFTYDYQDDGGSFAGGVLAECSSGPCVVDPNATHEYGQLWASFSFCAVGGTCSESSYPVSFFPSLSDGADVRSGSQSAFEILYPTMTDPRTVTMSFDLDTATFSALSPVPEPSTWALLAIGLIAIRLASRRPSSVRH